MTRDILLTAGVVLAAAIVYGLGWWLADRRGRERLADLRTTLTALIDRREAECRDLGDQLDASHEARHRLTAELDEMTRAHHRGAEEYERLLEAWRAVPEAFRAPLPVLDDRRDILTPIELLFDEWPVPRMDGVTADAAHLASILDAPTETWKRIVYRPAGATRPKATATWDTGTVHDGELLDAEPPRAGRALVPVKTYPAAKQRHGHGKRGKR